MNYYQPRELRNNAGFPSGVWHFTCMNDNAIWPIGYCAIRDCKHKTPEEATICYKEFLEYERNSKYPGGFELEKDFPEILTFISSY